MERHGIGPAVCLTVAIACALAGCPSSKKSASPTGTSKSGSSHNPRKDAGMSRDAAIADAALDGGDADAAQVVGDGGAAGTALKEPPAKYACTFASDMSSGHGYWFCATKTKREEGRSLCADLGGDFVIVDDAAENAMLVDQIQGDTYIGYSDALMEGEWVWVDGSKGGYENWDTKQPDTDDYALIEKSSGRWKTTIAVPLGFACEGKRLKH